VTSPATNPGTVASGAVYRCTRCCAEFSSRAAVALHGLLVRHHLNLNDAMTPCGGLVIDITRDDRAGVTLPTAIQPVGGDQLEPSRTGQVEGAAGADVVEQERSRP
jgi:hypothetical protein